MPKINVYLPDDLAEAVRETGVPVSAVCQRALDQAVRRITTIRQAVLTDVDAAVLAEQFPSLTGRLITVLTLAAERARTAGAATVSTGDLLHGVLAEGSNLALQLLTAMDVSPGSLIAPTTPEPGAQAEGLRFSPKAAAALELAAGEALGLGNNYVGCEHLLIALAAEPDGAAGELLRARGIEAKATRRAVAAALTGYAHLRKNTGPAPDLLTAVRQELAPLIERIERLEGQA
ncbi:type II toxin-antitoxin system CcdA family antitoxin [Actinoplanes sp. TRM 88003]|uniref:Type II toxin-antitoxin system CcdA family antitoxin n=1 Tax=Paractinoplanes aksuensis TaxID=2939490 RepID=A0ABT1E4V2_9ACTN|nr:Clp protease N-terminal domain-containing protein [Actinoplanes aksuensis]MCO8277903.1 type II toxin-antitoxin system CcdA family antitoxin [Actinoplanes aksuensis]